MSKLTDTFKGASVQQISFAVGNTIVWALFIVVGTFTSLQMKGNIKLQPEASELLGNILAAFTLMLFLVIIFKANFKKGK
jgi:hypothetical protein